MGRSLRGRRGRTDDSGMSIVEVLVASAILLFALTAMLGLLMTSTGLSARARAQALAVKTASAFIEQVRAVKYADLKPLKLSDLASAASGTVGGMTVSVEASMAPYWMPSQVGSGPPAYQQIKVLVHVTGPGFKSFDFATGTYVREWEWSERTNRIPTVQFDDFTPPAGATAQPVFASIHVGATAVSNTEDVMLTQVYVKIGTTQLTSATPNAMTGSCFTTWDTLTWSDGEYTLFAETWDALNGKDSKSRTFVVDNFVPSAPTTVTLDAPTGKVAWAQVLDGISRVPGYETSLEQQNSSGSWSTVSATQRVSRPAGDESLGILEYTTAPFSAYRASVSAIGAREWVEPPVTTPWRSEATVRTLITRPGLGGTLTVTQSKNNKAFTFSAALNTTPPTFQTSSTTHYEWQYRIGSGSWTDFSGGSSTTASTVSFGPVTGPEGVPSSLSVRCLATVVIGGTTAQFGSPIMSVANPGVQTYLLSSVTPDWTAWP